MQHTEAVGYGWGLLQNSKEPAVQALMMAVGITLFNSPFGVQFSWFAPFVLNYGFLEMHSFTYKCTDPELNVPACPKFRN